MEPSSIHSLFSFYLKELRHAFLSSQRIPPGVPARPAARHTAPRRRPVLEVLDGRTLLSGVTSLHFVTSPNVPNAGLNATAAVANNPNDVWAVGSSLNSSTNLLTPLAEHFNGTSWSVVPTATLPSGTAGQLKSVVAVASNNVWAVGDNTGPLIEHWDGTKLEYRLHPERRGGGDVECGDGHLRHRRLGGGPGRGT